MSLIKLNQKKRHTVIPAVHLFLIKGQKILLLRRFNTGYEDGNYSVPAGHVEKGETASQAMQREAMEEIGVNFKLTNLKMIHVMHRTKLTENEERVDFFFITNELNGLPKVGEPDKCDQIKWFSLNRLPRNMIPYVRFALKQFFLKKIIVSLAGNKFKQL